MRVDDPVSRPDLAGRVRFAGRLDLEELSREMRRARVLVMPSIWGEPFGLATIEGMVPALTEMPTGCRFNNRCPHADAHCVAEYPDITDAKDGHLVACHKWRELDVVEVRDEGRRL